LCEKLELEKIWNIIAWAPCNKREDRNDKKEKEKVEVRFVWVELLLCTTIFVPVA
jgi:hypothetical protein